MKTFSIKKEQFVPADISTVWNFFSNPYNLKEITPEAMKFEVITKNLPGKIYSGMLINYNVSPLINIKLNWTTLIRQVKERQFFIDEQLKGPYKYWQHKHTFLETAEGTIMTDEVEYALPFTIFENLINSFLIKKKLDEIFEYRAQKIEKIFPRNK